MQVQARSDSRLAGLWDVADETDGEWSCRHWSCRARPTKPAMNDRAGGEAALSAALDFEGEADEIESGL